MTANEKYELWLSKLPDADPLKQELLSLRGNETEIKERFTQDLHFGTAGLRGKVGAGTNNMNFLTIGQATQGIAEYIKSRDRTPSTAASSSPTTRGISLKSLVN